MAKHIKFNMLWAPINNIKQAHPEEVMSQLGIVYQYALPQPIGDQWWFWNCENIPTELPPYLEVASWNPMDFVGVGLDIDTAKMIQDYTPQSS